MTQLGCRVLVRVKRMSRQAIQHLSKADRVLGRAIQKLGPMALKPKKGRTPYEALLESIVYQQLNGKAAATILGRVLDLYSVPGRRKKFPTPEEVLSTSDKRLRGAGLSRAKTAAIRDLAQKALEGVVPSGRAISGMSDEEIVERLTAIRGIGRWTVEMLLIFKLGRMDVLPSTDFGVRKGFMLTYKLKEMPTPRELEAFGEKWRPFRTVASWYLWRMTDL